MASPVKKLVQAESGEYEQRCTHFVAVDAGAALRYLQETRPEVDWRLTDREYSKTWQPPQTSKPEGETTHHRDWFISPDGEGEDSDNAYSLSEIDLAE